jgi:hypothetical protein
MANVDAVGQIGLGVNFDPEMPYDGLDASGVPYVEPQDFMAWETSVAGMITSTVTCLAKKRDPNATYYVSDDSEPNSHFSASRLSSQGVFMATMVADGTASAPSIGSVYVEYECNMYEPVTHTSSNLGAAVFQVNTPLSIVSGAPITTAAGVVQSILGAKNPTLVGYSSVDGLYYEPATGRMYFPQGRTFKCFLRVSHPVWSSTNSTFASMNTAVSWTSSGLSAVGDSQGIDVVWPGSGTVYSVYGLNGNFTVVTDASTNSGGWVKIGLTFSAGVTSPVTISYVSLRIYEDAPVPVAVIDKEHIRTYRFLDDPQRYRRPKHSDSGSTARGLAYRHPDSDDDE